MQIFRTLAFTQMYLVLHFPMYGKAIDFKLNNFSWEIKEM